MQKGSTLKISKYIMDSETIDIYDNINHTKKRKRFAKQTIFEVRLSISSYDFLPWGYLSNIPRSFATGPFSEHHLKLVCRNVRQLMPNCSPQKSRPNSTRRLTHICGTGKDLSHRSLVNVFCCCRHDWRGPPQLHLPDVAIWFALQNCLEL